MYARKKRMPLGILYAVTAVLVVACIWTVFTVFSPSSADPDDDVSGNPTTQPTTEPVTEPTTMNEDQAAQQRQALLAQAARLEAGYFYDEAIELLRSSDELQNEETDRAAARCEAAKNALVKYEGQFYHVFFHSLIIDTSKAFDGDYKEEGYNMWMTTRDEFVKMLPLFLENGFVLFDITECVEIDANGNATPKDVYLPAGKKPLIISVDDVCYYDYMKDDGFAERLVLNDKGDVVTRVRKSDGTYEDTYDGDVFPIVDEFVKAHPEFSYRGAKGIVAMTGYQGALGYRISDLEGAELEAALAECKAVADRLKETGWRMANHSYTHNSYFRDGTVTMAELTHDTERWKKYIEPAVGPTPIYISPFGMQLKASDERLQYLVDQGYHIYCPVGSQMSTRMHDRGMLQDRLNLDGYTMIKHPDRISKHFFDPAPVVDRTRPAMD